MKLTKLATLVGMSATCLTLTHCTTPTIIDNKTTSPKAGELVYPKTRTHTTDYLISGEYGRPDQLATGGFGDQGYRNLPDDGIDRYAAETLVDEYRWLEAIDPIDPEYAKETDADRQRILVGSIQENDVKDGLFDNRGATSLQKVDTKTSSEVNDWVESQNKVADDYIQNLPIYKQVFANMDSLMSQRHRVRKVKIKDVGVFEMYRHKDGYYRFTLTREDGSFVQLFNERELSEDGNTVISDGDFYVSEKGSYIAYFTSTGSSDSDLRNLHVLDVKTGKPATRVITNIVRDSEFVEWLDDSSFVYAGNEQYGWKSLYRHDIGTNRFNDPYFFSRKHLGDDIDLTGFSYLDDDKRYLMLEAYNQDSTFYIKDNKTGKVHRIFDLNHWKKHFVNTDTFVKIHGPLADFVHFDEKTRDVYFVTGERDARGEIFKINLDKPNERIVVVEASNLYEKMIGAIYHDEGDGYFAIKYLKDGSERLILTDNKGNALKELTPQPYGVVSNLNSHIADKDDKKKDKKDDEPDEDPIDATSKENYISFRFASTINPRTIYKYSVSKDEFIDIRRRDLHRFDEDAYHTTFVVLTTEDGTKVPVSISHKKGITLNGKNPTILYGYGGFGVDLGNSFSMGRAAWLEMGGVWANAVIRGGREYGHQFHEDGKLLNKINSFKDFELAADYLNSAGYASPEYLAINGGSNGGLLVGAAMTRHPEKYRVALPEVGVLDMLRHSNNYHTQYWVDEYGTPYDSRAMYDVLKSYSPYHNIKDGTCYPATLVSTAKRDDRVTPSHSYKFAARLQDKQACANSVLLSTAQTHGHSPSTWSESLEEYAQSHAFTLHSMGITSVPDTTNRPSADHFKTTKWLEEEALEEQRRQKKIKELNEKLKKDD